jgi:hypothetical protein
MSGRFGQPFGASGGFGRSAPPAQLGFGAPPPAASGGYGATGPGEIGVAQDGRAEGGL